MTLDKLCEKLKENESWLIERVIHYAKKHDYTKYTSTLLEAWRASIDGLTESFTKYVEIGRMHDIDSNFDNEANPSTEFGKQEAIRHRDRGISISLFMGLYKYYKKAYIDLINEELSDEFKEYICDIEKFFDKFEIAFVAEWIAKGDIDYRESLLEKNSALTIEKNKYLIIFESLDEPIFILNDEWEIKDINLKAAQLCYESAVPGQHYYSSKKFKLPAEIHKIIEKAKDNKKFRQSITLKHDGATLNFEVLIQELLDYSGDFTGYCIIMNDVSLKQQKKN